LFLWSCQEEVLLDLGNTDKIPVIEAIWTDTHSVNRVVVSYSRDYYDTLTNEIISDADVRIVDETAGDNIELRYVGSLGHYIAVNGRTAKVGHDYRLEVEVGDNLYVSRGKTLEPPVLDSITYQYEPERIFRREGYYLTLYGKLPFSDNNYYRLRISRNDTLLNRRSDYFLFDDSFGTSILNNGFELSAFSFKKNDRVKLELYRLNRDAYEYLEQMVNLLFNDGGLFSPPPENPRSNIEVAQGSGRVLGYFMTSMVLVKSLMIVDEE
jgi:hypothetical protein